MSYTGLEWCPGCQINVEPQGILGNQECPQCGHSLPADDGPIISVPNVDDPLDIEPVRVDPITTEPARTPASGRLTLNPKVRDDSLTPVCPECDAPIQRVESPNDIVEFHCECDELRRFDFPERGEP